jgi:hypothetical protein
MLLVLIAVLFISIMFVISKSSFGGLDYDCNENKRLYPEGKVPGSYLGMNKYTEDQLTRKFNKNGNHLINEYIRYSKLHSAS